MSYLFQSRIDKDLFYPVNMGKYYRNCHSYQGFNDYFRTRGGESV
jgi:hypothetical protein